MFRGINPVNLDAKARLAISAKYRRRLIEISNGQLVLTVHPFDQCLLLYPLPEWERVEDQVNALPNSALGKARRLQHLMVGYATEIELDSASRVIVPNLHRVYADIEKRIMLVGQGNKFEIWSEERWTAITASYISDSVEDSSSHDYISLSI